MCSKIIACYLVIAVSWLVFTDYASSRSSTLADIVNTVHNSNVKSNRGKYPRLELYRSKSCSTQVITSSNGFFRDILSQHGLDDVLIDKLIVQSPHLLKLNPYESIIPKFKFLLYSFNTLTDSTQSDSSITYIYEKLRYFDLSLEKLIAPRLGWYKTMSLSNYTARPSTPRSDLINELFLSTDADFCKFMNSDICKYNDFKSLLWQGGLSAVKRNDIDMIRLLLDIGWNPDDDIDRSGRTPLMWACSLNSIEIVKLLTARIEVNIQKEITTAGETPFHFAAMSNNLDICKYLYKLGFSPNALDNKLNSPLHFAAGCGCLDTIIWLLDDFGIDINIKNKFGCTVMHYACSGGHLDMCKYLKSRNVNFHERNYHGHDGITKAVAFKKNHVVKWLIDDVYGVIDSLNLKRPWVNDTSEYGGVVDKSESLSLKDIALLVGNYGAVDLLNEFI